MNPNFNDLYDIVFMKMPYGKYKGTPLLNLPDYYIIWYYNNGFPKGRLGFLLNQVYEIQLNGLESLVIQSVKNK